MLNRVALKKAACAEAGGYISPAHAEQDLGPVS
jgi:hypothetical protein